MFEECSAHLLQTLTHAQGVTHLGFNRMLINVALGAFKPKRWYMDVWRCLWLPPEPPVAQLSLHGHNSLLLSKSVVHEVDGARGGAGAVAAVRAGFRLRGRGGRGCWRGVADGVAAAAAALARDELNKATKGGDVLAQPSHQCPNGSALPRRITCVQGAFAVCCIFTCSCAAAAKECLHGYL